jgi:hypothetical protein
VRTRARQIRARRTRARAGRGSIRRVCGGADAARAGCPQVVWAAWCDPRGSTASRYGGSTAVEIRRFYSGRDTEVLQRSRSGGSTAVEIRRFYSGRDPEVLQRSRSGGSTAVEIRRFYSGRDPAVEIRRFYSGRDLLFHIACARPPRDRVHTHANARAHTCAPRLARPPRVVLQLHALDATTDQRWLTALIGRGNSEALPSDMPRPDPAQARQLTRPVMRCVGGSGAAESRGAEGRGAESRGAESRGAESRGAEGRAAPQATPAAPAESRGGLRGHPWGCSRSKKKGRLGYRARP